MSADELRRKAKAELTAMFLAVMGEHQDPNAEYQIGLPGVDKFVDLLIDTVIAETQENYQVDVPNTGYFGIIVKK